MKIINITNNTKYLKKYIALCYLEWSEKEKKLTEYIDYKLRKLKIENNIILILGLVDHNKLVGFISLLKKDGDCEVKLTPWYATMYVKKEYRGRGYSRILNDALLEKSKRLGYTKVYLKSNLINYYEKFGAIYIKKLENGESLYYIDL